jgi:LuxR family transcriptional regulator
MNNIAHMKLITLPHEPKDRRLTKRQREVLEWVGDGKTVQDISQIMSLTPATIEKHLRLARETLNVETTAQAVLKASFNNQIFVIER